MAEYKPKAGELARLIGNPTAYAVQKKDGSYFSVENVTVPELKTAIEKHLAGEQTIGTYIVHGDKARTLVFDVDSGEDAKVDIIKIRKTLTREFGIRPDQQGVEFSGNKGFHVWVVFPTYVSANHLRRLGKAVTSVAGVSCEVFPKQDNAVTLGSLVKLPGGVHQKTGKPNNFLTQFPKPVEKAQYEAAVAKLPEEKRYTGSWGDDAFPCLTKIQEGIGDGGRNNALYHLAVMLIRNGLSSDNLWLVAEATNSKFDPPLDDAEFRRTVESALRGGGPICGTLPDEIHCGELCICRKEKGLYMRPKQLKYAGEGEMVVVQMAGRKGDVIELVHPDVKLAKARVINEKENE